MQKSIFGLIGQVALFGARAIRDAWEPPFEGEYLLTQFYEIGAVEWTVLLPVSAIMLGVALMVAYLSARPWITIDPMEAVRHA